MSPCGIQNLPSCNAVALPPQFLTTIPRTSVSAQVTSYNYLQTWVNTLTSSAWFDIFEALTASSTYGTGTAALQSFLATAPSAITSARVLVMGVDGKVYYDSGKSNNTYANSPNGYSAAGAFDGNINGNHNTRPDVFTALLFDPTGYGYASYTSSSVGSYNSYVSKRIGLEGTPNSFAIPGCNIRVSCKTTIV
jgi:hypothetical protein